MITADTLTDLQIRELLVRREINVYTAALCITPGAVRSRFETRAEYESRKIERAAARARCAEILNARGGER